MLAVMERVMPFVLFAFALASLRLRRKTGDNRHRQDQHEFFHNFINGSTKSIHRWSDL